MGSRPLWNKHPLYLWEIDSPLEYLWSFVTFVLGRQVAPAIPPFRLEGVVPVLVIPGFPFSEPKVLLAVVVIP